MSRVLSDDLPFEKSIASTHPYIAKILRYPERAYSLTHGSHSKEDFMCPDCKYIIKDKIIYHATKHGIHCPKCSDGISYPEKFILNVLDQLNIEFAYQKSFDWSWSKRYDFYIRSSNCIIGAHGNQHYDGSFEKFSARSLEEEQENDRLKEEMAKENGIEYYIVIDCRKSELEWIKENVLNSKLNGMFDLSSIDWLICHRFALSSLVKKACDLWSDEDESVIGISKKLSLSRQTIVRYLKQGSHLGWCDYTPQKALKIRSKNNNAKRRKKVVQLTLDGFYIKE